MRYKYTIERTVIKKYTPVTYTTIHRANTKSNTAGFTLVTYYRPNDSITILTCRNALLFPFVNIVQTLDH